jgi:ABC-type bacteriocin/lantibiotic exporter with double-glycine peptidase domain
MEAGAHPTWRRGSTIAVVLVAVSVCALLAFGATREVRRASEAAIIWLGDEGIVRQRAADDCGVAALAMLMRGRGHDIQPEQLFASAAVPPGGLSLAEMSALARSHGLRLVPAALPRHVYGHLSPPWVAHLSWNHYVVVLAVEGGRVVVADPRAGRLSYEAAVFMRAWSGYALIPST